VASISASACRIGSRCGDARRIKAPASSRAHVTGWTWTVSLVIGDNTVTIVVEAQDGTTRTYTIVIEHLLEHALERTFRARTATNGSWYNVPSNLRGIAPRVVVYVENARSVSDTVAQQIA